MDFQPWPKLHRLFRDITVTEKIDGSNAQVWISDDLQTVRAGSRTRWISPSTEENRGADNFGFARWVEQNREELLKLGPGHHYGEWYGCGIQRHYDLSERRFALFNSRRWTSQNTPSCCRVVPILYTGPMDTHAVKETLDKLRIFGSVAVPGFMNPEGIVVFVQGTMYKVTLDNNDGHKGAANGE